MIDIRGWLAYKELTQRIKQAKLEQNKVTAFCNYIILQSDCLTQSIVKTSKSMFITKVITVF